MHPLPAPDLDAVVARTRPLWDELAGARLLLTGGTGFFGRWIVETLAHANRTLGIGVRVVLLTRDPDGFRARNPALAADPALELLGGDVRDFRFPDGPLTHVVHAATDTRPSVPPGEVFDVIVEGTRRALACAVAGGARSFLLTSSGAVYGAPPPDLAAVPEDFAGAPDPVDLRAAYGHGKRAAETLCAIAHREHGLRATIARCFAFVGPALPLDGHFAIGNFVGDALAGRPIAVRGDAGALRSYLYAADLVVWLLTILLRGAPARPYNVGSDEVVSIGDLARLVADELAPGLAVSLPATGPAPGALRSRYVPDVVRARGELALERTVDLRAALRRTADWHRRAAAAQQVLDIAARTR